MWEQVKPWKYCKCNLQIAKLKLAGFHVTWMIENPDHLSWGLENPVVSCMANIIVSFICIFVFTSETKGITFEGLLITTEKYWVCVTVFMSLNYKFFRAVKPFSSVYFSLAQHFNNTAKFTVNLFSVYSFCSCCRTREQEQKYCYHGMFNYRAGKLTLSSRFQTILLHWNPDGLTISAFINVQDSNCAESSTAFKLKLITESVSESHSGLNQ